MLDALDHGFALNRRLTTAITAHQQAEPASWDRTDPASVLAVMRALESRYGAIFGDLREWVGSLRAQPMFYRDELYTRLDNAIANVLSALSTAQLERIPAALDAKLAAVRQSLDEGERGDMRRAMEAAIGEMRQYSDFRATFSRAPEAFMQALPGSATCSLRSLKSEPGRSRRR
jgi:hypothetical protein